MRGVFCQLVGSKSSIQTLILSFAAACAAARCSVVSVDFQRNLVN